MTRLSLFVEVETEARRAEAKFGLQADVPDGTGDSKSFVAGGYTPEGIFRTFGALAYTARQRTDEAANAGYLTWADILLEEVFEACCEDDVDKLRTELVQVAAVALRWVDVLDRRDRAAWYGVDDEPALDEGAEEPHGIGVDGRCEDCERSAGDGD